MDKPAVITVHRERLLKIALWLAVFTITYNVAEGMISTIFGYGDETITLFGFGLDSFVEVISGIGIFHMVWRMRRHRDEPWGNFEKRALQVTGTAFYILAAGLVVTAVLFIIYQKSPETTVVGIVISSISIATMYFLYRFKMETGKKLGSEPVMADASCTRSCLYLSIILLASSLLYEIFHVGYIDGIGAVLIAVYAFREGRESFEKARTGTCECSKNGGGHGRKTMGASESDNKEGPDCGCADDSSSGSICC